MLTSTFRLQIAMEDSHAIVLDLDDDKQERNAFFAVYDGHGGMPSPPTPSAFI